jgi:DNA-binding LytR/AlgR family response regulator
MSQALKLPVITCLVVGKNKSVNSHIIEISNELANLKVISVCETSEQTCEILKLEQPNVVFWDKSDINQASIDCLKSLPSVPQIVLLSKADEVTMDLPDYLVTTEIEQPFDRVKFAEAVSLVTEIQEEKEAIVAKKMASALPTFQPMQASTVPNYIFLRTDGKVMRFDLDEILFFHGHGEYVIVKTTRGEFKLNTNMKKLGGKLEHPLFLKTHRAFVINVSKISHIEENEVIIGMDTVLISRAHKGKVREKLNIL